ncbi:hypothetical protein TYRP_018307 [Tyrophagus putrescentiae]|nr:hypothetical protein TYRP_018307 [Tyrophagus putrescentiae]
MSTILDLNNAYLHDGHKLVIRIEVSAFYKKVTIGSAPIPKPVDVEGNLVDDFGQKQFSRW